MKNLVDEAGLDDYVDVESAGISEEHDGEEADPRSQEVAVARGLSLDSIARAFTEEDFDSFDYILAMDAENRDELISLAPDGDAEERIFLLRAFDPTAPDDAEVPDPYFGGDDGFDVVFDVITLACEGLLEHLIANHDLPG